MILIIKYIISFGMYHCFFSGKNDIVMVTCGIVRLSLDTHYGGQHAEPSKADGGEGRLTRRPSQRGQV